MGFHKIWQFFKKLTASCFLTNFFITKLHGFLLLQFEILFFKEFSRNHLFVLALRFITQSLWDSQLWFLVRKTACFPQFVTHVSFFGAFFLWVCILFATCQHFVCLSMIICDLSSAYCAVTTCIFSTQIVHIFFCHLWDLLLCLLGHCFLPIYFLRYHNGSCLAALLGATFWILLNFQNKLRVSADLCCVRPRVLGF